MSLASITPAIRARRSIFPAQYEAGKSINRTILEEMLLNAHYAPTHRRTEPWRFIVLEGKDLQRLSDYLLQWYLDNVAEEKQSSAKIKKLQTNPQRAGAVIMVVMQRHPEELVPEWEEVAAVSCAVQNMLLTAADHSLGAYWSSPRAIIEATEWLQLSEGQHCMGMVYVGHFAGENPEVRRSSLEDKIRWGL